MSQFFEKDSDEVKGTGGSIRFMAPELLGLKPKGQLSGKKIDMWALGVTLYNLLTNKFPFDSKSLITLRE